MAGQTVEKNAKLNITSNDKASPGIDKIQKKLKDLEKEVKKLTAENKKLAQSQTEMSDQSRNTGTNIATLAKRYGGLAVGVLSAAVAYKKINALMKESIDLASVQINSEQELTATLGYTSQSLKDYASALQSVSLYGDEAILSSMSQISAFIKEETQIKRIQKAAIDLAAAKKMDLRAATMLVTRSVVTGSNALKEYGIEMDTSGDIIQRTDSLLANIEKSYGGVAKAMAETDPGQIIQAKNAIGDLKEELGKELLPFLREWYGLALNISKLTFPLLADLVKGTGMMFKIAGGKETVQTLKAMEEISSIKKLPLADQMKLFDQHVKESLADLNRLINSTEKVQAVPAAGAFGANVTYMPEVMKKGASKSQLDQARKIYQAYQDALRETNAEIKKQEEAQAEWEKKLRDDKAAVRQKQMEKEAKEYKDNLEKRKASLKEMLDALQKLEEEATNNYLDNIQSRYEREKSIREQNEENAKAIAKSAIERIDELNGDSLKERETKIKQAYDDELAKWKFMMDQKIISEIQFNELRVLLAKDTNNKLAGLENEENSKAVIQWKEKYDQISNIANTTLSGISNITSSLTQMQIAHLDEETEFRQERAKATIKNERRLALELEKIEKDSTAKRKEIAKGEQRISLLQSIISTAEGVARALATPPPWYGISMAATIGTLGAIQTGIIASQAFAKGGVVQQEPGIPSTGDRHLARVNPGERILTEEQNALYERQQRQSGLNVYITGSTYNVSSEVSAKTFEDLQRYDRENTEYIVSSIRRAKYRGMLEVAGL